MSRLPPWGWLFYFMLIMTLCMMASVINRGLNPEWKQYSGRVVSHYDTTGCLVQCDDHTLHPIPHIRPVIGAKVRFAECSDGRLYLYDITE